MRLQFWFVKGITTKNIFFKLIVINWSFRTDEKKKKPPSGHSRWTCPVFQQLQMPSGFVDRPTTSSVKFCSLQMKSGMVKKKPEGVGGGGSLWGSRIRKEDGLPRGKFNKGYPVTSYQPMKRSASERGPGMGEVDIISVEAEATWGSRVEHKPSPSICMCESTHYTCALTQHAS